MKYPVVKTTTMITVWMCPKQATKSDESIVMGRRPTKPKIFTYGSKNCIKGKKDILFVYSIFFCTFCSSPFADKNWIVLKNKQEKFVFHSNEIESY